MHSKGSFKQFFECVFVCFVEFGTGVNWVGSFIVLSILDRVWVVGAMLQFRRMWVLIPELLFGHIGGHC